MWVKVTWASGASRVYSVHEYALLSCEALEGARAQVISIVEALRLRVEERRDDAKHR